MAENKMKALGVGGILMRLAIRRSAAVSTIALIMICCGNPVEPDSIWTIDREGEWIWFVKSDHKTPTDTVHINQYAHISLYDYALNPADTTRSIMFISSIGDSERVRPFTIGFNVVTSSDMNYAGASIYLRDNPYSRPGDGALDVGKDAGTIKVIYYHRWTRDELQISATVRP